MQEKLEKVFFFKFAKARHFFFFFLKGDDNDTPVALFAHILVTTKNQHSNASQVVELYISHMSWLRLFQEAKACKFRQLSNNNEGLVLLLILISTGQSNAEYHNLNLLVPTRDFRTKIWQVILVKYTCLDKINRRQGDFFKTRPIRNKNQI